MKTTVQNGNVTLKRMMGDWKKIENVLQIEFSWTQVHSMVIQMAVVEKHTGRS